MSTDYEGRHRHDGPSPACTCHASAGAGRVHGKGCALAREKTKRLKITKGRRWTTPAAAYVPQHDQGIIRA